MSWFSELFHGGKNPADAASPYLQKIPGAVTPYYKPYIEQGQRANNALIGEYGRLINNPNELYDKFSSGYKESPGYQTRLNEGLQAASNAAAAGGMAGSPQHQQVAAQHAVDMRSKDFEDFLNHIFGLYGTGLQGQEGLGREGYEASRGYGDILGSNLAQQGQLAYEGQAGQNANRAGLFNNIISGASTVGGAALGRTPLPNLLPSRSYG